MYVYIYIYIYIYIEMCVCVSCSRAARRDWCCSRRVDIYICVCK